MDKITLFLQQAIPCLACLLFPFITQNPSLERAGDYRVLFHSIAFFVQPLPHPRGFLKCAQGLLHVCT